MFQNMFGIHSSNFWMCYSHLVFEEKGGETSLFVMIRWDGIMVFYAQDYRITGLPAPPRTPNLMRFSVFFFGSPNEKKRLKSSTSCILGGAISRIKGRGHCFKGEFASDAQLLPANLPYLQRMRPFLGAGMMPGEGMATSHCLHLPQFQMLNEQDTI